MFIKELFNEILTVSSGQKEAIWNGTNSKDKKVVSGIYIVIAESPYYTATNKISIAR